MVKIERINNCTDATILRKGHRMKIRQNMIIDYSEVPTLTFSTGSIVYSVDETEVITLTAPEKQEEPDISSSKKIIFPESTKKLNG